MDNTRDMESLRREHIRRRWRAKLRRFALTGAALLLTGVLVYRVLPHFAPDEPPAAAANHVSDTELSYDAENWNLILVNPWNEVPEDWECTLTQLRNGHAVDERCYPDLQEMMDACRAEGLNPLICSSYRTHEYQQKLFDEKTAEYIAQGYGEAEARRLTATSVAVPGTSEHQLGLAVDIVGEDNQMLDSTQETSLVQQWLMANSWRYGFILRYPNGKTEITGIIYEPWHYRYVGREAAEEIYEQGITLEEYLDEA